LIKLAVVCLGNTVAATLFIAMLTKRGNYIYEHTILLKLDTYMSSWAV